MKCQTNDYAIVIRSNFRTDIGRVVRVLTSDRAKSVAMRTHVWDVQAGGGRFFSARDMDLLPLHAYELKLGVRDELWDDVWIYSDYDDGLCALNQVGLRKRSA